MSRHRNEDHDEDLRREAIDERRRNRRGCLCGHPDWPGQCPGAANCPVHGENDVDPDDCEEAP
jgi:hypothetical protein